MELGASSWALGLQPSLVPQSSRLIPSLSPTGPAGSRSAGSAAPAGSPVYLDLAYLPSGGSARLVDEEFFRRVRALCYVISGQDQQKEEGMRAVLDALLAGKQQWGRQLQVCGGRASESPGQHGPLGQLRAPGAGQGSTSGVFLPNPESCEAAVTFTHMRRGSGAQGSGTPVPKARQQ